MRESQKLLVLPRYRFVGRCSQAHGGDFDVDEFVSGANLLEYGRVAGTGSNARTVPEGPTSFEAHVA
jgi:hypothetical protein